MHITVQTYYDIQYLTMCISGYMNYPTEPALLSLRHGMEDLIRHPHKLIMYSRKKFRANDSPHKCFFKAYSTEINKNQEYPKFLHTYCDAYHAQYISNRRSVTSTAHIFNVTVVDWCKSKQSETSRSSSNA